MVVPLLDRLAPWIQELGPSETDVTMKFGMVLFYFAFLQKSHLEWRQPNFKDVFSHFHSSTGEFIGLQNNCLHDCNREPNESANIWSGSVQELRLGSSVTFAFAVLTSVIQQVLHGCSNSTQSSFIANSIWKF